MVSRWRPAIGENESGVFSILDASNGSQLVYERSGIGDDFIR
jgi:hypothetical protein